MDKSLHGTINIALKWESRCANHTDHCHFENINFWRDAFPGDASEQLAQALPGASVARHFQAGELVPAYDLGRVRAVLPSQVRSGSFPEAGLKRGRFYRSGLLATVSATFPQDRRPFRCLNASGEGILADWNHPLASYAVELKATLLALRNGSEERGGRCNDVAADAADNGPGLQAATSEGETDFFSGDPFRRKDDTDDSSFYRQARLVNHLDSAALALATTLYGRFLKPGDEVLDLMASWDSHLPADVPGLAVTGLGMNSEELKRNPVLYRHLTHDLNREPELPLDDGHYDVAVCTVSVEYLTRPVQVFREVARVLKPGAPFVVTFSDRWFPPKVVGVWSELHPFERMGLVVEYFRQSGEFSHLHTESFRGLPRPPDDKYARLTPLSDPVYAVWGRKVGRDPGH